MPVEVHQEYLQRRFIASWCSTACLLNGIILIGAGILPLYIAWASRSFWIREALRWEQPSVEFTDALLLRVNGLKGATPFSYSWSSSPAANDLLGGAARAPIVKALSVDSNSDGKVDEVRLRITLPLASDEAVYGVTAAAYLNTNFYTATRVAMDGLALISHWAPVPGTQLLADGDLNLMQRESFPSPAAGVYTPYLYSPLPDLATATSSDAVLLSSIIAAYRSRNFTMRLDVPLPYWRTEDGFVPVTPGSPQDLTSTIGYKSRSFELLLTVRVPPMAVRVRPGVSEELKHGWIQYLSFLVITLILAWMLRKLLFGLRVVETSVYVDAPRSKVHLE